jgi:hypothetical protein
MASSLCAGLLNLCNQRDKSEITLAIEVRGVMSWSLKTSIFLASQMFHMTVRSTESQTEEGSGVATTY